MRLAMYGGTFNPIHLGHMHAARAVVEGLQLDKLLLVPAGLPPHKTLPQGSATPAQRLRMCWTAARQLSKVEACGIELDRQGPSYTVDTLQELKARYPEARLWLVVGTDMALSFERWREPRRIASLCRLAVVARDENDRAAIAQKAQELRESLDLGVDIIHCPALPMSSTQVRESLSADLLHPAVLEYVQEQRLYLPSLSKLRAEVEKRVSPKRMAHILGCEQLAAQMAARFGKPDYDARAAAILHDCTKGLTEKEQLTLCEKWNIIFDYGEDDFSALIHADTGAEVARREFCMPREIVEAIRTHTTAQADMTDLQQLIYVADLCEPTRVWPGVEELRALALYDLQAAYKAALEHTLDYIRSQGREPYYKTQRAYDVFKKPVKETEDKIWIANS